MLLIACANVASLFRRPAHGPAQGDRGAAVARRDARGDRAAVPDREPHLLGGRRPGRRAPRALGADRRIQAVVGAQVPPNTVFALNWRAWAFIAGAALRERGASSDSCRRCRRRRPQLVETLKDAHARFVERARRPPARDAHRRRGRAVGRAARRVEPAAPQLRLAAADAARIRSGRRRDRVRRRAHESLSRRRPSRRDVLRAGHRPAARQPADHERGGESGLADRRLRRALALQRHRPADSAVAAASARGPADCERRLLRACCASRSTTGRAFNSGRSRGRARRVHHQRDSSRRGCSRASRRSATSCLRGRDADVLQHDRRRHRRREEQRRERTRARRDLLPDAAARQAGHVGQRAHDGRRGGDAERDSGGGGRRGSRSADLVLPDRGRPRSRRVLACSVSSPA